MIKQKWMDTVFSDGTKLFLTNNNPKMGEWITIKIRMAKQSPVEDVYIRYLANGEEVMGKMTLCKEDMLFSYYEYNILMQEKLFIYRFVLITKELVYFYNQKGIHEHACLETYDFKILVDFDSPDWVQDSIFYQIFPDRFCNGNTDNDIQDGEYNINGFDSVKREWDTVPGEYAEYGCLDFYGGDLQGIEQKIRYLKDLGVNTIYLNPIFSAYTHHKYDCIDYFNVDKCFGGNEAFAALCKALHGHDMKIVLDISINHTGIIHQWTKDKKDFYYTDKDGEFKYWLGVKDLPTLNYECKELREVIYKDEDSVLKRWMKEPYCIDGWRFDVGQSVGKMHERHIDQLLWREIRQELKASNPNMYFLAEHWDDCIRYLQGDMWDSTMNYYGFARTTRKYLGENDSYLDRKLNGAPLKKNSPRIWMAEVNESLSAIPYQVQRMQMNLINSHDVHRFSSIAEISTPNKKTAIVMLFTFLGVPSIYYGDEINLKGRMGSDTGARYPMEWDESKWDQEILALYKIMINLRKNCHVLKHGSFKFIEVSKDILCYVRFDGEQAILFANSQGNKSQKVFICLDSVGSFRQCDLLVGQKDNIYSLNNNEVELEIGSEETVLLKFN